MNNHYHLLVETHRPTLARGMRDINGVYAQAFNRRHDRVGHLFQGRYVALLVQKQSYLLELSRYIALNPVRAGLCARPEEWLWSSYGLLAREVPLPDRLAGTDLLAMFGFPPAAARLRFQEFVRAGVGAPGPSSKTENRLFLGDDEFVTEMTGYVKTTSPEVPESNAPGSRLTSTGVKVATETPRFDVPMRVGPIRLRRLPIILGCTTLP